jgi:predicted phage terminase large subunit-like protein
LLIPLTPDQADQYTPAQQAQMLKLAEELQKAEAKEKARDSFLEYARYMWSPFIEGRHHKVIADAFDRIISGDLKRLIIALPPRHTKSEFASWLLPSKYLGHNPDHKIIQASHTAELAVGFGRRVRNLVATDKYKSVFPDTQLTPDSKAAGRWATSKDGSYFAIGVGGAVAGKGADLFIIDDAHSEQEYMSGDPAVFDRVYEWYTSGPRQRLQPDAAVVVVGTRWHTRDLTGRLVKSMTQRKGVDQWEVIEFPAIMPSGKALWDGYWPLRLLEPIRAELPSQQWAAQYLQNPSAEEGALIKRGWWNIWEHDKAPECEFIIQSWDTAFLKTQRSDYSACTTWGVFYMKDDDEQLKPNIILLDAYQERLEFPELKKIAYDMYMERKPDAFIIEGKASGMPLIFELRAMGIPVADYTPVRGTRANPNDKVSRVNGISDLFASGIVWCPQTRWAEEVMEQFNAFPEGEHDDLVDSGTIALHRFRQGGFLQLDSDEVDEPSYRRTADYY